jgi:hypothetical protein
MEAKSICDEILLNIKSSGLNFVLTETPFSVKIEIKKTFFRRSSKFSSKQCNLDGPSSKSQTMGSILSSTNSKGFTSSFEITKPTLQKYSQNPINTSNKMTKLIPQNKSISDCTTLGRPINPTALQMVKSKTPLHHMQDTEPPFLSHKMDLNQNSNSTTLQKETFKFPIKSNSEQSLFFQRTLVQTISELSQEGDYIKTETFKPEELKFISKPTISTSNRFQPLAYQSEDSLDIPESECSTLNTNSSSSIYKMNSEENGMIDCINIDN